MSALQRKYFGKGHKRVYARSPRKKRKVYYVSRRRYYAKARGFGSKAGGKFGGVLPPIVGGLADNIIDRYSPVDGLGSTAVGMFMGSRTVRDIGLYKVGFSIGNILPIPGLTGGSSGGAI